MELKDCWKVSNGDTGGARTQHSPPCGAWYENCTHINNHSLSLISFISFFLVGRL